jgi:hypothetical protein
MLEFRNSKDQHTAHACSSLRNSRLRERDDEMMIKKSKSFYKLTDLRHSAALAIFVAALALGVGACSEKEENVPTPGAATSNNAPAASGPLKGLRNAGKDTTFSIDIVNGQAIPKSGPIVVKTPQVTMGGWAVDQQAQSAAGGVYVTVDGKTDVPTEYGGERKDVAEINKNPRYRNSGFAASVDATTIGKGRHTLGLKILTADGKGYYEPDTKIDIEVQ